MPSQRYKLTIAYRGALYHGWQKQLPTTTWKGPPPPAGQGIPTIQEILTRELVSVVGHPVSLVGSSRTDAGVHAKAQVAHFDTTATQVPPEPIRRAVNARLPEDILVRSIEAVPDSFDAINSTISKRYQYFIWHAPDRDPLLADLAWHRWQELNIDTMREAAARFLGEHDFASFARTGHGRENTIRTVRECSIHYRPPRLIIGVEGAGFLWQMVRIMVGTLVEVGLGQYQPQNISMMLKAADRAAGGSTAPPQGLYLQWIKFGDNPAPIEPDDPE